MRLLLGGLQTNLERSTSRLSVNTTNAPASMSIDRYCTDAGSSETGGILVGHYSEDLSLAIVLEATPPPTDSRRGHTWFVRGVGGLRDMLSKRWRAKERTYYVGEWHFHPAFEPKPSEVDFSSARAIANDQALHCPEPILLIIGGTKKTGYEMRAFVVTKVHGHIELEKVTSVL